MNPSEKNKANKESLLLKYYSGSISKDEMHLLNQYALDDDFLFEAMEGLSANEEGNKVALSDLSNRLKGKDKGARRIYLYWMSAAASIAILIFAVNFLNPNKNKAFKAPMVMEESAANDAITKTEKTMADDGLQAEEAVTSASQNTAIVESEVKNEQKQEPAKITEESIASNSIPAPPPAQIITQEPRISNLILESEPVEEIASLDEVTQESISNPIAGIQETIPREDIGNEELGGVSSDAYRSESKSAAPIASNALRSPSKNLARKRKAELTPMMLSGSVRSQDGEPIIGAYIYSLDDQKGTFSDKEGAFALELPSAENRLQISSAGFQKLEYAAAGVEKIDLVLERKDLSTIKVVSLHDDAKEDTDTNELLDFQNFVNRNFAFPDAFGEQERTGFVTIEFDIDTRGKLENITVVDSMGYGADEEAVRLVESYTKWGDRSSISKRKKKLKLFFKGKR